jgi:hypothetical protein
MRIKPFYRVFHHKSSANRLCDSQTRKGPQNFSEIPWPFFPVTVAWLENPAIRTPSEVRAMRHLQLLSLIGVTFLLSVPGAEADDNKPAPTQSVIAEGAGTTADEALKDAFRSAVRQVVGAVVDAETLVKNDELITDKVLTFSNGFVKKYDELSKKEDKGIFRIKIKAEVERKGVVEKLKAANVKVKDVDGKGLFAEAVTDLEREKDAAALLKKTLEGFPQNSMTASVVGEPKVVEKTGDKASVSITVQIEPNMEAYKTFVKKLQPVLEKMVDKDGKGDFLVASAEEEHPQDGKYLQAYSGKPRYSEYGLGDLFMKWMPKGIEKGGNAVAVKGKVILAVATQANSSKERMEYCYYLLDESLQKLLVDCSFSACQVKMAFSEQGGDSVTTDRFEIQSHLLSAFGNLNQLYTIEPGRGIHEPEMKAVIFFLSPTFIQSGNIFCHKPKLVVERKLTMSLDELKKVQKVKVELQAK